MMVYAGDPPCSLAGQSRLIEGAVAGQVTVDFAAGHLKDTGDMLCGRSIEGKRLPGQA